LSVESSTLDVERSGVSHRRFPFHVAGRLGQELLVVLAPLCEPDRCTTAGSLRRLKPDVGDIEIVYVPKIGPVKGDTLFGSVGSLVDEQLARWLAEGVIQKRPNANGGFAWGEKNKLAIHAASGIPVDFFATTKEAWFNYLVCRTGGKNNNQEIAMAAQKLGLKWNPYGIGFSKVSGLGQNTIGVCSEEEVFKTVGLPYRPPWERN